MRNFILIFILLATVGCVNHEEQLRSEIKQKDLQISNLKNDNEQLKLRIESDASIIAVCRERGLQEPNANNPYNSINPDDGSAAYGWVMPTGTKYHTQYCKYVDHGYSVYYTLAECKRMGYKQCSVCNPP